MPTGTERYFSKDNWGDRFQYDATTGQKVKKFSATQLHSYVDALKQVDWIALIKNSHQVRAELGSFLEKRKRAVAALPDALDDDDGHSEDSGMWSDPEPEPSPISRACEDEAGGEANDET